MIGFVKYVCGDWQIWSFRNLMRIFSSGIVTYCN